MDTIEVQGSCMMLQDQRGLSNHPLDSSIKGRPSSREAVGDKEFLAFLVLSSKTSFKDDQINTMLD